MPHTNTSTLAAELTEFLVSPDRYTGASPLQKLVQEKITVLADEIATLVVAEHPGLRDMVRDRTVRVVASLIADEGWLEKATVAAVSKALGKNRDDT